MKITAFPQFQTMHPRILPDAFTEVSSGNHENRLVSKTVSMGFIVRRLAEDLFSFNRQPGVLINFMPEIRHVADEHPIDLNEANTMVHKAVDPLTISVGQKAYTKRVTLW